VWNASFISASNFNKLNFSHSAHSSCLLFSFKHLELDASQISFQIAAIQTMLSSKQ
jgi:hypothetical protein